MQLHIHQNLFKIHITDTHTDIGVSNKWIFIGQSGWHETTNRACSALLPSHS